MLQTILSILFFVSFTNAQFVAIYGQCGGEGFTGLTNCAPGTSCIYSNPWYSQCLPTGIVEPTTASPVVTVEPGPISTNGYFTAKNGRLYDADGKEFLIRGINSAHLWFDNYNRNYALNSLTAIRRTNANLVRIVWGQNPDQLTVSHLETIIQRTIELEMIPMVELHDATGSSDVNSLLQSADWFKNNIDLFKKYQKYVLINIANEWSPWGTTLEKWRDAYNQAINIIRSTGWGGALIIDASAYAQNPDGPIKYGSSMVQADPAQNLVFSIHTYAQWKQEKPDYNIATKFAELSNSGITYIIGEFASTHPEGCNWVDIDVWQIMRECKARNVGYIGWSWHGNGRGDCNSDLAPLNVVTGDASVGATWVANDYTEWGNALVNYEGNGLKDTGVKASYF